VKFSLRRLVLTGALIVFGLAAMASSAQAAVTASTITSPAANSYFYYDVNATSSTLFTVTGTTTGTGNVDIGCYDGFTDVFTLASNQPVTNNAFSVAITTSEITSAMDSSLGFAVGSTCVLRAVDTGDAADYEPGSSTSFSGPVIALTLKDAYTTGGGVTYDYDYFLSDFAGYMDFESPGDCGLEYGIPYTTTFGGEVGSFSCLGGLYDPGYEEDGSNFGGEIKVDGIEALDSDSATTSLPGYEGITLTDSYNAGALTIHDDEPLLECVPSYSSCTSYKSSGVELDRTWQTADDGLIALQTDVFRSVDGAQHGLAVLEDDDIYSTGPSSASLDFPGSSGFQDYAENATLTLPSGAGTILFKTDSATPDAGDGTNPQGGITYSSAPNNGPVDFSWSDESSGDFPEFVLPYTRTVPAGGSVALRFAYEQSYSLSQVQALASAALASFSPTVSIAAPGNGTTVSTPAVAVTGTVSDAAGISSVKVNGVTATLGSGGTFAAPVPLAPGANTITATATDSDGITGTASISVTYHNPPVVTTGKASKISSSGAKVAGTVNPEGQAAVYEVQYGKSTAYGSNTTAASAGSGSTALAVTSTIKGLKAHTTYHYRVVATNGGGTSYGADATFKTAKPSPKGLGTKVSPKTATSFPYHYKVKGKLSRPSGITAKQGCSGKITIKVKRGSKTISTSHAKVGKKCTWSAKVTLSNKAKVPGTGKLKITPSFGGNGALAALTGKSITVHYG
jgi:hypothetical protein